MLDRRDDQNLARRQYTLGNSSQKNIMELYGKGLAKVFKEYLPYVSRDYEVVPYQDASESSACVASFDVRKLVVERDDSLVDKLKNVYHLLANTGGAIALIISRTRDSCRLSIAVRDNKRDSGTAKNHALCVRDALMGNFPGTECSEISRYYDGPGGAFEPLNQAINFGRITFGSIGIVSNIATDYADSFSTQGIERLIDSIRLGGDERYTIVLQARSLSPGDLAGKKEELYELYTFLSPYARVERSWSINESESWAESGSAELFGALAEKAFPILQSLGLSNPHTKTQGTNKSNGVTITEYGVAHTLETIERQMKRLEECEALGLWEFAAYVISKSSRIVNEATHMYMSLTQGKESFFERPSINIWDAESDPNRTRPQIEQIRRYLTHLEHPSFRLSNANAVSFNQCNWPSNVRCITEISGSELTRALNLPSRSIPGLPVIECAAFGRDVSSYDNLKQGDILLGNIHHMHHDESRQVSLSSSSLTSHVFVCGSTGAGKSNTVCQILDRANRDYLVVEPAKGEYWQALGADARHLGTNPLVGELLRLNPFAFPEGIHVFEHVERIVEVFNVCWPMYAAMPAVLKDAIIGAYGRIGWDLGLSTNPLGRVFPTFSDICDQIDRVIEDSDYSDESKGNYRGSLKTRLKSLTTGVNGLIFCGGNIPDQELFDSKVIVDLSRMGSSENKALVMGVLVIRLQEYRMCEQQRVANSGLRHICVLEEAHNILRANASLSSPEMGGGMAQKSVEMLANAIAEMRTYGESFIIVDQAPGLLDPSAIRNTNTKIIMRLPDQGDRELVGRAANLNDAQIQEVARFQRGVAAVYQNEWIEPVLCSVHRFRARKEPEEDFIRPQAKDPLLRDAILRIVDRCMIDPDYIGKISLKEFVNYMTQLELPPEVRSCLLVYANGYTSKEAYQAAAFAYFDIKSLVVDAGDDGDWSSMLRSHIKKRSTDTVGFDDTQIDINTWKNFSALMFEAAVKWAALYLSDPEKTETIERLARHLHL